MNLPTVFPLNRGFALHHAAGVVALLAPLALLLSACNSSTAGDNNAGLGNANNPSDPNAGLTHVRTGHGTRTGSEAGQAAERPTR